MELLYLWTKSFNNLKGGYSLSSKYHISYNNRKLIFSDNKSYIEKFFDIKNNIHVSAIVGENGSGKSSILKLVIQLLYNEYNQVTSSKGENFLIVEINENFYYISESRSFSLKLKLNNKEQKILPYENRLYTLYFNYMLDSLKDNSKEDWIDNIYHKSDDYTMPILLEPYKRNNNIDINNLNYLTRQRMMLHRSSFKKNVFLNDIFNPIKVKVSIDTNKVLNIFQSVQNGKYTPVIKKAYKQEFSLLYDKLQNIEQEKRNIDSIQKRFKNNQQHKAGRLKSKSEDNVFKLQEEIKNIIQNDIPYYAINNLYIANKIDKYHKHIRDSNFVGGVDGFKFDKNNNKIEIIIKDNSHNTLKLRNSITYHDFILNNSDIKNVDQESYIEINDKRLVCLPSWFEVSFFDENEITFTTLSAGEKSFYILLTTLIYQINNIVSRSNLNYGLYHNMLIMLDEADLGLHPKWQRKYLYNILETLKESSSNLKYHVVCTSHSPFIVSDLPKDNILFLNNGEVDSLESDKHTFGENIHTLLNDSFFMQKDMMMGQLAENKIKDAFYSFEKIFDNQKRLNNSNRKDLLEKNNEENYENQFFELKDEKRLLKIIYVENYQYFKKLNNIIGEEYIKSAFENSMEECNKIFNIEQESMDEKRKILEALEKNPSLAKKWIEDIE